MSSMKAERFQFEVEALPGWPGTIESRLRLFLKSAQRSWGIRCLAGRAIQNEQVSEVIPQTPVDCDSVIHVQMPIAAARIAQDATEAGEQASRQASRTTRRRGYAEK